MELKIHNAPRNPEQGEASKGEDNSGTRWQWLLDGGVFDNKPLSLSLDLAKLHSKRLDLDHTIYIDQDRRRLSVQEEKSGTSGIEHFGIKGLIGMLSNTASSARKYELFTTGRYLVDIPDDGSVDAPLQATDRYPRVAADHLQAFGAFMGRPLREHDFYAGVYDGLFFYASNYVCKGYLDDALDRCVTDWIGSSELLEQSEAGHLLVMNPVFFKIVDTISAFKPHFSLQQIFQDSVSLAQRARNSLSDDLPSGSVSAVSLAPAHADAEPG